MKPPTPTSLAVDCFELLRACADGDRELLVNIMVSERCNFKCDHCMMRSGPHAPAGWISEVDIDSILGFVDLVGAGASRINIIGGEPTLNPNVLDMILRRARGDGRTLEMTTNGWWLRDPQPFCNVMRVLEDYLLEDALTLRISSSEYHDTYRGDELRIVRTHDSFMSEVEESFQELRDKAMKTWLTDNRQECYHCDAPLTAEEITDNYECPHCEREMDWKYELEDRSPVVQQIYRYTAAIRYALEHHLLHVDRQSSSGLTNNGRAADFSMATRGGGCAWDEDCVKFTFKPGALVYDFCCSGGPSAGGHADDGLLLLLRRALLLQHIHDEFPSSCRTGNWDTDPAEFDRCGACPRMSVEHLTSGSKWDILVNKALPILQRKLNKYNQSAA